MFDFSRSELPVAVIGAGPVGLAAAAHLVQRKIPVVVIEQGEAIAANLDDYRHVRLFSPWRYNIDHAARALLEARGWTTPPLDRLPTAGEVIDEYLVPLSQHPAIANGLQLNARVTQITRAGFDKLKTAGREKAPFVLRVDHADGELDIRAQAVIDASGTWNQPNPLGANGLFAPGEVGASEQIAYGMPDVLGRDRQRYAGKRVLVVGAGHSAVGTLIVLATLAESEPATRIVWAIRGSNLALIIGGGDADGLPARGALGKRLQALVDAGRLELHDSFRIAQVQREGSKLRVVAEPDQSSETSIADVDEIIGATGSRPNLLMASQLRLKLDAWLESTEQLAPLIDPNVHSCGSVRAHGHRELAHPEVGYYAIGAKSYGRAPNFLMATGYEQARSVVAAIAGDIAAADDVQLELPETGVCRASFAPTLVAAADGGCCGGPAPAKVAACCATDAEAKEAGAEGCGCGPKPTVRMPAAIRVRAGCCA